MCKSLNDFKIRTIKQLLTKYYFQFYKLHFYKLLEIIDQLLLSY